MDDNPRYVEALRTAKHFEAGGKLAKAIDALDVAEHRTHDEDELQHLRVWRDRLRRDLAIQRDEEDC